MIEGKQYIELVNNYFHFLIIEFDQAIQNKNVTKVTAILIQLKLNE